MLSALRHPLSASPPAQTAHWVHHGTTTGYRYGCRCTECKAAKRAYNVAWALTHKRVYQPKPPVEKTVGTQTTTTPKKVRTKKYGPTSEQKAQYNKRYRQSKKGRAMRVIERQRRRGRVRNALGSCTPDQLMARVDYYGGLCWMCGVIATTIDHVIPLALGGTNWPANLRPACLSCNSRKGAKLSLLPAGA